MRKALVLIGVAAAVGLVAGVLLDVATFLVARYGPEGGNWSFRGNGALAVPFGLGPAILAAAWVALVLRYRGFPSWLRRGILTLLFGVGYLILSVIVLFLTDLDFMLVIVLWMLVAPIGACFVRAPGQRVGGGSFPGHLGAGIAFPVALVLGFYALGLILPPGS